MPLPMLHKLPIGRLIGSTAGSGVDSRTGRDSNVSLSYQWALDLDLAHSSQLKLCAQGDEAYAATLHTYATAQINYMLGDGGRSYVVGFGETPPSTPFHKWCARAHAPSPVRCARTPCGAGARPVWCHREVSDAAGNEQALLASVVRVRIPPQG